MIQWYCLTNSTLSEAEKKKESASRVNGKDAIRYTTVDNHKVGISKTEQVGKETEKRMREEQKAL